MNLSKLVWTLQNSALYFCRCDLLGDPYEGYYPKTLADDETKIVDALSKAEGIKDLQEPWQKAQEMFKALLDLPRMIRSEMFVNCWHMNEAESSAMWKLYTSQHESICIKSTYAILADALPGDCYLGCIKYIDYMKDRIDYGNLLNYIVHKRKSFEHERELRAVIWRRRGGNNELRHELIGDGGLVVPVNINKLIQELCVSPDSDPMFREVVQGLARTHGVTAPVRQSEVNAPPTY